MSINPRLCSKHGAFGVALDPTCFACICAANQYAEKRERAATAMLATMVANPSTNPIAPHASYADVAVIWADYLLDSLRE